MTIHQGSIGAGSAGSDTTAIHKNIANEISTITEKTEVVGADIAIIEDSEASGVKKKMALSSLGSIYEPNLPETPENPSNKFLDGNKMWVTVPIGGGGVVDNDSLTGEGTEASPFQISEEYQRRINAGI